MSGEKPSGWLVDLSLIAVALIWGATFILVKQALAGVSTLLFLTLRFAIAAVALALIFRKEFRSANVRRSAARRTDCGHASCSAATSCKPFGLKYTSASKTGFHHRSLHSAGAARSAA